MDYLNIGSSVSVRGGGIGGMQLHSGLSVFSFVSLGSGLSIRRAVNIAEQNVSILAFTSFGSSMSMRSFSKLGGEASIMQFISVGSAISVRSFARLGSYVSLKNKSRVGDDLHLESGKKLYFNGDTANIYMYDNSNNLEVHTAGGKTARFLNAGGGYLHGSWTSEGAITVASDARLKKEIVPLYKTMSSMANNYFEGVDNKPLATSSSSINATQSSEEAMKQSAAMLFTELRPVSYYMNNHNVESKNLRFGFIAQEIERLMPNLVKTGDDKFKSVYYNDLIALITLTLQHQISTTEGLIADIKSVNATVAAHDSRISALEITHDERIRLLEAELLALKKHF